MSKASAKKKAKISSTSVAQYGDDIPLPVIEIDLKHNIVYINKRARKLLGIRKIDSDSIFTDFIAKIDISRYKEVIKNLKSDGDSCITSIWLVSRKGKESIVQIQLYRLKLEDKSSVIRIFLLNPTPPKPLAGTISVSDKILQKIIENSHDGLAILGEDYVIEYISRKACSLLGGKPSDFIGHDFREFLTDEIQTVMAVRYRKRRKGERVSPTYPVELTRKDGTNIIVEVHADVVSSPGSRLKSIIHFLDITEQVRSRKELEESLRRNRTLVETMDDGLAIDNKDGVIVFANPAYCEMLGYKRDELVGKKWVDLTRDKDEASIERRILDRMSGKSERYELWWIRKNGEHVPTIVSATPYFTPDGEFLGSFAVITDITDMKETEETVQFYLDLLTHDVANQLQVIMTSAGMLDSELPEFYIEDAQSDIMDAVERCNRLITKVKRASQIRKIPLESIDISRVVHEKVAVLERVYGATVHLNNLEVTILVRADLLLGELVWNLLENAARHNPKEDKQVWVSCIQKSGMVVLSIADNGPGISKSRKRALFDRSKRQSGVGLTLITQMARKYGGKLELLDRVRGKPNLGAKFVLWLHEIDE